MDQKCAYIGNGYPFLGLPSGKGVYEFCSKPSPLPTRSPTKRGKGGEVETEGKGGHN